MIRKIIHTRYPSFVVRMWMNTCSGIASVPEYVTWDPLAQIMVLAIVVFIPLSFLCFYLA